MTGGQAGGVTARTTLVVAAVSALVASVVSVATTLVVVRLADPTPEARPFVAVPTGSAGPSGTAAPAALDLGGLFASVGSGVVRVETTACVLGGSGSGFLVAPDLVVTAAHVVDGAHTILLRKDDGTGASAAVLGLDTVHDVALLRAEQRIGGHVFSFADADPAVGADVAALGYPRGGPLVPLRRTVTGRGQSLDVSGATAGTSAGTPGTSSAPGVVEGLLRLDGGFEGGASGGPLVAADGTVVGLVEGRSATDGATGYAVSALRAAPLVATWRTQKNPLDVADACEAPVGPPQSTVVVRDASGSPLGAVVTDVFGRYASAINSTRYEDAWAMLGDGVRKGGTLEEWAASERSSQIFDAIVREVDVVGAGSSPTSAPAAPSATGSASPSAAPVVTPGPGGSLRTVVEFSSTQEDRFGRGGQTCSRWRVTYTLVRGDDAWRIDVATLSPGFPQAC